MPRWIKAQSILLSYGVTAVGLMSSLNDPWRAYWDAYKRSGERGKLNVRLISYTNGIEPLKVIPHPTPWLYGDRLRMVGVKFYADGALGSRGAWLKQPYADKPDTRGLQFHSDAEMLALADARRGAGFQVATHAIGDAANAQVISRLRAIAIANIPATGAGGSSISRSPTPPTFRASPRPGSSPRCSPRTRPATG